MPSARSPLMASNANARPSSGATSARNPTTDGSEIWSLTVGASQNSAMKSAGTSVDARGGITDLAADEVERARPRPGPGSTTSTMNRADSRWSPNSLRGDDHPAGARDDATGGVAASAGAGPPGDRAVIGLRTASARAPRSTRPSGRAAARR